MIDYNFLCFRKAIQQVFELRNQALAAASMNNNLSSPIGSNDPPNAQSTSQKGAISQNGTVVLAQS